MQVRYAKIFNFCRPCENSISSQKKCLSSDEIPWRSNRLREIVPATIIGGSSWLPNGGCSTQRGQRQQESPGKFRLLLEAPDSPEPRNQNSALNFAFKVVFNSKATTSSIKLRTSIQLLLPLEQIPCYKDSNDDDRVSLRNAKQKLTKCRQRFGVALSSALDGLDSIANHEILSLGHLDQETR